MQLNPRSSISSTQVGIVASHYGSFVTSGERFNGVWEEEEGLAFIDREWRQSLRWEAPRREIEGFYNFYIQSESHLQCGEFNGVPSRNQCRVGAVQFMQPDETVHTAGVGQTRTRCSAMADFHGRTKGNGAVPLQQTFRATLRN
jgi:hypothetical protein